MPQKLLDGSDKPIEFKTANYDFTIKAPGLKGSIRQLDGDTRMNLESNNSREQLLLNNTNEQSIQFAHVFELDVNEDLYKSIPRKELRNKGIKIETPEKEPAIEFNIVEKNAPDKEYVALYSNAQRSCWCYPKVKRKLNRDCSVVYEVPRSILATQDAKSFNHIRLFEWIKKDASDNNAKGTISLSRKEYKIIKYHAAGEMDITSSDPSAWEELNAQHGKTLLLIHGTAGTPKGAFGLLLNDAEHMTKLRSIYGNRIIAFAHPSIRKNTRQNAKYFIKCLPKKLPIHFDVLTRSRGALVARDLIENFQPKNITFDKLMMVAGPNQGSHLANVLDLKGLANLLVDVGIKLEDEMSINKAWYIVRHLLKFTINLLPGLKCQSVDSPLIKKLNTKDKAHSTLYYALTCDYEPSDPEKAIYYFDELIDKAFEDDLKNDGVVACASVMGSLDLPKAKAFPIALQRFKEFPTSELNHLNYFKNKEVLQCLVAWIEEDTPREPIA